MHNSFSILLVDDDDSIRDIIQHYITELELPLELEWADNSLKAVTKIKNEDYDIILLDQKIDSLTGFDIFDNVAAYLINKTTSVSTPVIMLTNSADPETIMEAMHKGFSDYLSKSVLSRTSFNRAISNVLDKYQLQKELIKFNNIVIEKNHSLQSKNHEIENFYEKITHELDAPLTAILEFTSILMDDTSGKINAKQCSYIHTIHDSANQIAAYLNKSGSAKSMK